MAFKEISPQQAYDLLGQGTGFVYIDVRTVDEFVSGHPESAVNIPIAFHDPAQGMVMNQEFLPIVQANYSAKKKIIVSCQADPARMPPHASSRMPATRRSRASREASAGCATAPAG